MFMRWANPRLQCRPKHAVGMDALALYIVVRSMNREVPMSRINLRRICINSSSRSNSSMHSQGGEIEWNAAVGRQNKKQGDHQPLHTKPSQSALAFSHYVPVS